MSVIYFEVNCQLPLSSSGSTAFSQEESKRIADEKKAVQKIGEPCPILQLYGVGRGGTRTAKRSLTVGRPKVSNDEIEPKFNDKQMHNNNQEYFVKVTYSGDELCTMKIGKQPRPDSNWSRRLQRPA